MDHSVSAMLPGRDRVDELLYRSLRAVYHYERRLKERFGLDFQEIYFLQLLRKRGAMRIGVAGALLEAPKFEATRLVQKLEGLGLVSKDQAEGDGRAVLVRIVPEGIGVLQAVEGYNYRVVSDPGPRAEADFGALLAAAASLESLFDAPPDDVQPSGSPNNNSS